MAAQQRFLQLADVAETLNISSSQVYALVRNGALDAVKIGGRGQWRVEVSALEAYIARLYEETRAFVQSHPFTAAESDDELGELGELGEELAAESPSDSSGAADQPER